MKTYSVIEIFESLQGEGARVGTQNVFVRFSGCNMRCSWCDTLNWGKGRPAGLTMTDGFIIHTVLNMAKKCRWVIFTGGEPLLQLDLKIIQPLKVLGIRIAIETNGSIEIPRGIDYIAVSPKFEQKNYECVVKQCDEVRIPLAFGQQPPPVIDLPIAKHYYLSPINERNRIDRKNLKWCIDVIREDPAWKLSVQEHKIWKIR